MRIDASCLRLFRYTDQPFFILILSLLVGTHCRVRAYDDVRATRKAGLGGCAADEGLDAADPIRQEWVHVSWCTRRLFRERHTRSVANSIG